MLHAVTDNHRRLDNLSFIYRIVLLARSLKLAIPDLLTIAPQPIAGVFATPAATLTFVQRAGKIAASGFSVDQLTYVLSTAAAKSGITGAQVASDIVGITGAMQKVQQSVYGAGDLPITTLGKQFAELPPSTNPANPSFADPGQAKTALSIVDDSDNPTGSDPTQSAFININAQFALFMTSAELANAVATLTTALATPATGTALGARANLVLGPLVRYLMQTQVIAAVGDLALAADATAVLMNTLTVPPARRDDGSGSARRARPDCRAHRRVERDPPDAQARRRHQPAPSRQGRSRLACSQCRRLWRGRSRQRSGGERAGGTEHRPAPGHRAADPAQPQFCRTQQLHRLVSPRSRACSA